MKLRLLMFIMAFFAIFAMSNAQDYVVPTTIQPCTVSGSTNPSSWETTLGQIYFSIPGHPECVYFAKLAIRGTQQLFEYQVLSEGLAYSDPGSDCADITSAEVQNTLLLEVAKKYEARIDPLGLNGNYVCNTYKASCVARKIFNPGGGIGGEVSTRILVPLEDIAFEGVPVSLRDKLNRSVITTPDGGVYLSVKYILVPCGNTVCCRARYDVVYTPQGEVKKFTFVDVYSDVNTVCTSPCTFNCNNRPTNWPANLNNTIQANPNPSNGIVTLQLSDSYTGDVTYQVVDATGNVVATGTISLSSGSASLNLSNLPNGVYTIRYRDNVRIIGTGKITIRK